MNFGTALDLVMGGHRARREWWLSSQFIYLVPGSTFTVNRAPLLGIYPEGTVIQYSQHIDMHVQNEEDGSHHCHVWDAPQIDVMATDWEVMEALPHATSQGALNFKPGQ